jgi:hypothetical protein
MSEVIHGERRKKYRRVISERNKKPQVKHQTNGAAGVDLSLHLGNYMDELAPGK